MKRILDEKKNYLDELREQNTTDQEKKALDFLGDLLGEDDIEYSQIEEKPPVEEKKRPDKNEDIVIGFACLNSIFHGRSEEERLDGVINLYQLIKPTHVEEMERGYCDPPVKLRKVLGHFARINNEKLLDVVTVLAFLLDVKLVEIDENYTKEYLGSIVSLQKERDLIILKELISSYEGMQSFQKEYPGIEWSEIVSDREKLWSMFFKWSKKRNLPGMSEIVEKNAVARDSFKKKMKEDQNYKLIKYLSGLLNDIFPKEDVSNNVIKMIDCYQKSDERGMVSIANLKRNLPANLNLEYLPYKDYDKVAKILGIKNGLRFVKFSDLTLAVNPNEETIKEEGGNTAATRDGLIRRAKWGSPYSSYTPYREEWE